MDFALERLAGQETTLAVDTFSFGYRLETVWWLETMSICLNVVQTYTPLEIELTTNNKMEECEKELISTLDDVTDWTDPDAAWLDWGECGLASGSDWSMYAFEIEDSTDLYILGAERYDQATCFPGVTPFSEFWLNQDNPFWGYYNMMLKWM